MNKTFTKLNFRTSKLAAFLTVCTVFMLLFAEKVSAQSTVPTPYCVPSHINMAANGSCYNNYGFAFLSLKVGTIQQPNIPCTSSSPSTGPYRYWNTGLPNHTTIFSPGANYTITMQTVSVTYIMTTGAWIDYNQNNNFEANEFLLPTATGQLISPPTATFTYNFTVPCTALPGKTRMRVRCDYNTAITNGVGCGNVASNYGETMDYDVTIATAGLPSANFVIPDTIFTNSPAVFTNSNQTGYISHKWYTSVGGLTNQVGSATNFTYAFNTPGTYQVRLTSANCQGAATVTKNVVVVNPTRPPTVRFVASRNYVAMAANDLVVDETIDLFDFSTQGPTSFTWEVNPAMGDWFNTLPLTAKNTSIFFIDTGSFEVCLTATNSIGSSRVCKPNYLLLEYPQNSNKYINTMCLDLVSTLDSGIVYDPGGKDNSYPNTAGICKFTIEACEATVIELTVVNNGYSIALGDYLRIYDGTVTGKQLASMGNNVTPGLPMVVSATSGKVTLEFQTDATTNGNGFEIRWKSTKENNGGLKANFKVNKTRNDTIYECLGGTEVSFTNTSTGSRKIIDNEWIFDYDPGIAYPEAYEDMPLNNDYTNPTFLYPVPKTYKVRLVSTSCEGNDTIIKTFSVGSTTMTPDIDFTADDRILNVGGSTLLRNNTIASCSGSWNIVPATYTLQGGTTLTSEIVNVKFTAPGRYTVKYTADNDNGTASKTKSDFIKVIEYCTPSVNTMVSSMSTNSVKFNTIDNPSGFGSLGYEDYTNIATTVMIGGTYQFSTTRDQNANPADRRVWIDYNRDGDFDATELIAQDNNTRAKTLNASVTIPDINNVIPGSTRMRVVVSLTGKPLNPCGPIDVGEFEDYTIILRADDMPPVITLIGSDTIYIEKNTSYTDQGATGFDNIEGNITPRIVTLSQVDTAQAGINLVTYSLTDGSGISAAKRTRYVFVLEDMTVPVLTLNGGATTTHEVKTPYTDAGATAIDNPGATNISHLVITNNLVDENVLGTYDVLYTITDLYGNKASSKRTVTVVDTKAPVINAVGGTPMKIQVGSTFTNPTTVTDNYYTNVQLNVLAGGVNTAIFGDYKVTYGATDGSGNIATPITRTYSVTDMIPPVLTSTSGTQFMIVDVNDINFAEPAIIATDNHFPTVNVIRNAGSFDISKLGTYDITYTGTDGAGNVTVWVRTIKVVDRVRPVVISMPVNVQRWMLFDARAGVSTVDNFYSPADFVNSTNNCRLEIINNNVNTVEEGIYQVIYQAVDGSGNVSEPHLRLVNVKANTTGIAENALDNSVSIYPNPNNGMFDVTFSMPVAAGTTVKVVSTTGQLVQQFAGSDIVNGKLSVNLSGVSAGIYFVQLQSEGHTATKKITVTH